MIHCFILLDIHGGRFGIVDEGKRRGHLYSEPLAGIQSGSVQHEGLAESMQGKPHLSICHWSPARLSEVCRLMVFVTALV